jgi:hypothetical protein
VVEKLAAIHARRRRARRGFALLRPNDDWPIVHLVHVIITADPPSTTLRASSSVSDLRPREAASRSSQGSQRNATLAPGLSILRRLANSGVPTAVSSPQLTHCSVVSFTR